MEDASAEKIRLGPAVAEAFDQLEAVVLPLGLAIAPGVEQRGTHSLQVLPKTVAETPEGWELTACRLVDPTQESLGVARAHGSQEGLTHVERFGESWMESQVRFDRASILLAPLLRRGEQDQRTHRDPWIGRWWGGKTATPWTQDAPETGGAARVALVHNFLIQLTNVVDAVFIPTPFEVGHERLDPNSGGTRIGVSGIGDGRGAIRVLAGGGACDVKDSGDSLQGMALPSKILHSFPKFLFARCRLCTRLLQSGRL